MDNPTAGDSFRIPVNPSSGQFSELPVYDKILYLTFSTFCDKYSKMLKREKNMMIYNYFLKKGNNEDIFRYMLL